MRLHRDMQRELGQGIVVPACPYGRKSGKTYRLWMSEETQRHFTPIAPAGKDSWCEDCKAGRLHQQAQCPQKGDTRGRIKEKGHTGKSARLRMPPRLAKELAKAMQKGWEDAQSRHGCEL